MNLQADANEKLKLGKTFIALDGLTQEQALGLVKEWGQFFGAIKVGMELFYQGGPAIMHQLRRYFTGAIFLDLKLHDIPQTVASAIQALAPLNPEFLTIHLAGGQAMLASALEAIEKNHIATKLLGVSMLTSLDAASWSGSLGVAESSFLPAFDALANLAAKVGLHGLILSPLELARVKDLSLLKVCPGIQFRPSDSSDQKRVATPSEAFTLGADYLVIGRAWRNAPDRQQCLKDIAAAESKAKR